MIFQNLGFGSAGTPKLHPELVQTADAEERRLANIIATLTETERERRREVSYDPDSTVGLLGNLNYLDAIPWDELLTGCVEQCAERAGVKPSSVVSFALEKCNPNNYWALFWFGAYRQVLETATSATTSVTDAAAVVQAIEAQARSKAASRAAAARVENDPKADKKRSVKELWELWQREPSRYKNQAAFARDMLDKYGGPEEGDLQNQAVIEGWCRGWKKPQSAR